ncbi:hypothetical protein D6C94_03556 [Aureobasidium pullulans]|uniref:Ubiquitin-like domain-containing protein n=1 Tax=Aureobasidium pullulans TaxID=5580 RepID=A0AB38M2J7_AURPU|nr:hypothetical protein D6C94_03556 [Aureobasidium pullulans]
MALKKLFIPTVGLPKANPEHGPDARSEMVKMIEESVRDTSDCLGQRILGPGAHRTVLVKGNSQCSSPSEASVMAEVFQVLRAPRPNRRTRARSVLDKSEDEGQAGSENVAGLSANFDDATFLERGEAATAKAAAKEAAAKAKAAREEELANAATAARETVEEEATTAAAIAKAENEKAIAEARAAHEKSLAEAKAAKKAAEAERDASNRGDGDKAPIKFTDAVDRSFTFPWHMVNTWEGMTTLIKQAFVNIEYLGPHVANGNYHLLGPNDEIILPQVWSWVLQPGWDVKMQLLPLPESIVEKLNAVPGTSTPAITTIAERAENIPPRRSKKAGGDKASKEFVFAFANDDSSDDPIVEVFIHSDDSHGRSCHTKNKVRKQSSLFSEWMLGGIRPRARPRKHKHLSRSRGVRKTNKRSEMVDGVADDVLGSDDSQSQSSGWLTEYDEGSSGHEPLENISVKRFSGRTSPTDMTPQFNSSPPILPQRRSSDSGLCLEQGSLAVLDEPDSTSTGGSSEVIDNDASKRFESIENIIPPSTADISGSLLRNWFVPKDGINRQVISANIQRYLGNDATVRPGQDRVDGSEVQGYWIKAYRSLTTVSF